MKPDLVGRYGDFNLFEFEGVYYALSDAAVSDNADELIKEKKATSASTKDELEKILDHNSKWADSRGMYGLETETQSKVLRVNSFNMIETNSLEIDNPEVVVLEGIAYLVDKKEIEKAIRGEKYAPDINEIFLNAVSDGANPELIFEYKHHNIVEFDKIYYGIPLSHGPIDLAVHNPASLSGIFTGNMIKDVMELIDAIDEQLPKAKETHFYENPTLVHSQEGFNYVGFKEVVLKLAQDCGPIDLDEIDWQNDDRVTAFDSLSSALGDGPINETIKYQNSNTQPELVKSVLDCFNVVKFKQRYYLCHFDAGDLDLTSLSEDELKRIPSGETVEDADELALLEFLKSLDPSSPFLIESQQDKNIIAFDNKVLVLPHEAGHVDFGDITNYAALPGLKVCDTWHEALSSFSLEPASSTKAAAENTGISQQVPVAQTLIEEFSGHNIFEFEKTFFAIPLEKGSLDLKTVDYFTMPEILYDVSLQGLKEAVRVSKLDE